MMPSRPIKLTLLACLHAALLSPNMKIVDAFRPSQYGNGSGMGNAPPPSRAYEYQQNQHPYDQQYQEQAPPPMTPSDNQSVEERLESWRQTQQQKYEHQSPIDAANPRDEDGKMKLLASVSRGSIALFFFILMWRSVHHYELADQMFTGITRLCMVIPPVILFLGNMAGCVGSLMSSGGVGKKRMKAILNLNKLVEVSLMAYNVFRLVFVPSKLILREIYVGRTLSNFLFLVQCQLFTKVTWNAAQVSKAPTTGTAAATGMGGVGGFDGDDENDGGYSSGHGQSYDYGRYQGNDNDDNGYQYSSGEARQDNEWK